jgi:GT2 family glycosyltransferase/glycosyltransferase involved in cell wall biosynthesis
MARVTAITIHHHGKEMLDECLRSLLASTGVELEVVVVANACDEELPSIVHTSNRVHLVALAEPVGFAAANNLGVAWASEHLEAPANYYFVNNDTWSSSDALEILSRCLSDDDRAAVVGPQLLIQWSPAHINSLGLNVTEDAWGWDEGIGQPLAEYGELPARREVVAVTGSALLMDAGVYHEVGGWTELYEYYFEDIDLCLKARSAGHTVLVEPAAVVHHHVSATMTIESEHKFYLFWRNRLLLAMVHWPPGRPLGSVLRRVVVDEIVRTRWRENRLQRRALAGALGKLPAALAARRRHRAASRGWYELLRPAGSVPVITLPDRPAEDAVAEALETDPPAADVLRAEDPAGSEAVDGPPPAAAPPQAELPASTWQGVRSHRGTGADPHTLLILGWGPLPFENERMNYAPGARTWQLAHGLAADGHRVVAACSRMPGAYSGEPAPVSEQVHDGVLVFTMEHEIFEHPGGLEALVDALCPDALVGASSVPSLRAARLAGELPVWVDLFGDPMAEAQARALVHADVEQRGAYRDLLAELLERGDRFSAVSERQRLTALGQLGLAGRLGAGTAGYELVHTIPCAVTERARGPRPRLVDVSDDELVVLWSGGFNTWCDVDTLFTGLERAMEAEPRLRCVTTGGEITGHDECTYRRWLELVAASPHRDAFTNKGCLPEAEAALYRDRADLGVVTERLLLERVLGSSGRLVDWLGAGVPFVCSSLSELGHELATEGLALVYEPGDPDSLAACVLTAAGDPERLAEMARRARAYATDRWSELRTTEALRTWAHDPGRAPDHAETNPVAIMPMVRAIPELEAEAHRLEAETHRLGAEALRLEAEVHRRGAVIEVLEHEAGEMRTRLDGIEAHLAHWQGRYHETRSELGRIHQSTMWRVWMRLLRFKSALGWPLRKLRGG